MKRNDTAMFDAFADLHATVLRTAERDGELWSEWEMSATAADGRRLLRRGPVILTARGDRIDWARFYVDPVDDSSDRTAFSDGPAGVRQPD